MKYFLGLLILVGIFAFAAFNKKEVTSSLPSPSPSPSSAFGKSLFGLSENEHALIEVEIADKKYRLAWEIIEKLSQVDVGINDDLASSSAFLKEDNNCTIFTSGGFYQTTGKPIGLIISKGKTVSNYEQNQLFNGVVGLTTQGLTIHRGSIDLPNFSWALQAGPIVWENYKPVDLRLNKDQDARRIVAAVTDSGALLLAVVTAYDSVYSGPLLEDLPSIVAKLEETAQISIKSAMNMDGGTASAYFGTELILKELKPIGSFVCVK